MNVVNFSDGIDGLAAGVCAISAVAFAVIAFDLERNTAGTLAGITAGAAAGFLLHNFPPAKVFMGDTGAMLLGLLLGCIAVEGAVKTQAVLALVFPLIVLAVPFLDTAFVVLKRLKYRRPVYQADQSHFHHRMSRIGFSQRRTVLYLYGWTVCVAGFAVLLRFVPYSDVDGTLNPGWSLVMALIGLAVLAASVYLVYVLEILKFKRLTARRLRRSRPGVTEREIEADATLRIETGQFDAIRPEDVAAAGERPRAEPQAPPAP
jgi:UDP-GlcNAc:undecaprenyl-phosphate GlcNAc-1-phosphate transferase